MTWVYLKLLEEAILFIPQADSYWTSTCPSLMKEFLNIRGCLTHILALNHPSCSHLCDQGRVAEVIHPSEALPDGEHGLSLKLTKQVLGIPTCFNSDLNYAFLPCQEFLPRSMYNPTGKCHCHNQSFHGSNWPTGLQRLTVRTEDQGIRGL